MDGVAGPRLRDAGLGLGVSRSFGPALGLLEAAGKNDDFTQMLSMYNNYLHLLGLNCMGKCRYIYGIHIMYLIHEVI